MPRPEDFKPGTLQLWQVNKTFEKEAGGIIKAEVSISINTVLIQHLSAS